MTSVGWLAIALIGVFWAIAFMVWALVKYGVDKD